MSMYKLHIIDQGLNVNVTSKKEEKKTTLIYTHVLYLVVKIQIMLIHRVYKITVQIVSSLTKGNVEDRASYCKTKVDRSTVHVTNHPTNEDVAHHCQLPLNNSN